MKTLNKSWLVFALVILLVASLVTGCGSNSPAKSKEPVTIEFWHTYSDKEEKVFNEQVIPLFEKKYPNIKVKLTRMPTEGLKQQVIAAAAGDAVPDLMRMDIVWLPEFAKLGALMSLDDKQGFADLKAKVFPGPLATNQYKGKYYGLPLNTNTKVAIYNKALLAELGLSEPPKTFDDLIKASETLKDKGKWGIGYSGTAPWGSLPYFWSLGGKITDDKYTKASGYLNSAESVAALEQIVKWYKDGIIGPSLLGKEPSTWDGIKKGQYLMIDDGPWFYSILGDEVVKGTVATPFPSGKGGSLSVVGGENLVIFKNSKHPNEGWTFMQFLLTDEPQTIMAQTGLIPTLKSAANSEKVQANPLNKPYIEQLKTAQPRTPSANWGKIEEALNAAVEKAVRGAATPQQALDEAAQKIDGFLQEN